MAGLASLPEPRDGYLLSNIDINCSASQRIRSANENKRFETTQLINQLINQTPIDVINLIRHQFGLYLALHTLTLLVFGFFCKRTRLHRIFD